jgi:hypothetical protein
MKNLSSIFLFSVTLIVLSLFWSFSSTLYENHQITKEIHKVLKAHIDYEIKEDIKPEQNFKNIITPSAPVKSLNLAPELAIDSTKCKKEALWGKEHGGGWTICLDNIPSQNCVVYSYGLGADWSFDNSAEDANCEVHGFDPTGITFFFYN